MHKMSIYLNFVMIFTKKMYERTLWLSARVLNSRLRGCSFEPHQRHSFVPLCKTIYPLLSTGSIQEDPVLTYLEFVDWDVTIQIKQKQIKCMSEILFINVFLFTLQHQLQCLLMLIIDDLHQIYKTMF